MFHTIVDTPGAHTPADLLDVYLGRLADVIDTIGVDHVVAETPLDRPTVEAIAANETGTDAATIPSLDFEAAAAVLALDEGYPDTETILEEDRTHLLMGMSTAVLDVDTIAVEIDLPLDPKEIQAKLEGRHPMTLEEFAVLHQFIASRSVR